MQRNKTSVSREDYLKAVWEMLEEGHVPISARLAHYHIAYSSRMSDGLLVVGLYIVATCGPLLLSGYRHVVIFGFVNLIAVAVLARITIDGFASLWCAWAAVTSGAIAAHLRLAKPHRALPYVLT